MTPLMFSIRNPRFTFRNRANGLTLIEMLIGMAITLVMMAAVVTLFANVGQSVSTRRAGMEMNGQLRMVRSRLFKDLAGATCPAKPWREPGNDEGYIEIIEGRWSDKVPTDLDLDATSIIPGSQLSSGGPTDGMGLGDYDDILALTVRSESEPFVGRGRVLVPRADITVPPVWQDATIKSNTAEVIWYSVENPADGSLGVPGLRTVYRRVFLIAEWYGSALHDTGGPVPVVVYDPALSNSIVDYQNQYDISVRIRTAQLDPNTLGDLSKRESRFGHNVYDAPKSFPFPANGDLDIGLSFPHIFPFNRRTGNAEIPGATDSSLVPLSGDREGEDVMLNDVLAFDLRMFDPEAELVEVAGSITEPSDAGWRYEPDTFPIVGEGAYVDLNYWGKYVNYITNTVGVANSGLASAPSANHPDAIVFSRQPSAKSHLGTAQSVVYDTWSMHYEDDKLDQDDFDNDGNLITGADEYTNDLDDDNINGTDDVGERETSPPYDVPLRGMQVKIRIYERDTRQIREATVTKNFSD